MAPASDSPAQSDGEQVSENQAREDSGRERHAPAGSSPWPAAFLTSPSPSPPTPSQGLLGHPKMPRACGNGSEGFRCQHCSPQSPLPPRTEQKPRQKGDAPKGLEQAMWHLGRDHGRGLRGLYLVVGCIQAESPGP